MANAKRDENSVTTLTAALSTTGASIVNIKVNPSTHGLMVDDASTGSNFGPTNALRDENDVPIAMGISSVDGVTPVAIYGNSSGALFIDSN